MKWLKIKRFGIARVTPKESGSDLSVSSYLITNEFNTFWARGLLPLNLLHVQHCFFDHLMVGFHPNSVLANPDIACPDALRVWCNILSIGPDVTWTWTCCAVWWIESPPLQFFHSFYQGSYYCWLFWIFSFDQYVHKYSDSIKSE